MTFRHRLIAGAWAVYRAVARATSAARNFRHGYAVVRLTIAVLLLTAAALKAHQLMTEPFLGDGLFHARWFLIAVVEFELFFGLWLLSSFLPSPSWRRAGRDKLPSPFGRGAGGEGSLPGQATVAEGRLTWLAALACFSIFACYSLYEAISGAASCGCFGSVELNPWYTFTLDVAVFASLLLWRPSTSVPLRASGRRETISPRAQSNPAARFAIVFGAWLLLGVPAAFAMSGPDYAVSELGEVTDGGRVVVLQPQKWTGKRLPLLPYIDAADRLSQGEWLVVLYRHNCLECRAVMPYYKALARDWSRQQRPRRIALVELPPFGEEIRKSDCGSAVNARLADTKRWLVNTPLELVLEHGTLRAWRTGNRTITPAASVVSQAKGTLCSTANLRRFCEIVAILRQHWSRS